MTLEFPPENKEDSVSSRRHQFMNKVRSYRYQTAREETPQAVFEFEERARMEIEAAQLNLQYKRDRVNSRMG